MTVAEQIKWNFKVNGNLVIRDKDGKLIYREYSSGFWERYGFWEKYEYDSQGNKIYFENSNELHND